MQMREDLEDLDVVVHRRGSRYLAKIPQLGLYATGDTLANAVEALEAKKRSLLQELAEAGALNEIGVPSSGSNVQTKVLPALALFAAKGAIVVALVLAAVGYTRHALRSEIDQFQAAEMGGARFWADFETSIQRAADPASDLPADKRQALLKDLRIIVDRWRPFMREADRLFSDQDSAKPGNP
jgi:hypothetical protein